MAPTKEDIDTAIALLLANADDTRLDADVSTDPDEAAEFRAVARSYTAVAVWLEQQLHDGKVGNS